MVFVLNHYPEAAVFELTFGKPRPSHLHCLDTGVIIPVVDGKAVVDIDRKSCGIFSLDEPFQ